MKDNFLGIFSNIDVKSTIIWLKETILFFTNPRKFVDKINSKPLEKLFSQYLFYFILYTFSFLFFSLGSNFTDFLKPALLNLSTIIPQILIFTLTSKIATNKNYFKKIVIFILSLHLFLSPFFIIIYSLFLNSENYLFKLILNCILSAALLFTVFGFGFIIEHKIKKSLKIIIFNYLFINILFLIVYRINYDPYGGIVPIGSSDPIFKEYYSFIKEIQNKKEVPVIRTYTVYKDNIETNFLLQNLIKDSVANGNDISNKKYTKAINENIIFLNQHCEEVNFRRNKSICNLWIDYFKLIDKQISFKIENKKELDKIKNLKILMKDTIKKLTIYSQGIPLKKSFILQFQLKDYHNNIIKLNSSSEVPLTVTEKIILFVGNGIDHLLFKIFDEGKMKPYKEEFINIKQ